MILIFGGTTEGRIAAETLDGAGKTYYYSTKGDFQQLDMAHGIRVSGVKDAEDIAAFIVEKGIKLIIDAAHPFAENLRKNIHQAAEITHIDVIRFERRYHETKLKGVVYCRDFEEAIEKLRKDEVKKLLVLTGVQTIARLKDFWKDNETYFRILDRNDSIEKAAGQDISHSQLRFYDKNDPGALKLMSELKPDAAITKESGESGGFDEKVRAAKEAGVKLYVVERPKSREAVNCVFGKYGLRRAVERLLPGFFDLRIGFTTGSCATAACVAAVKALINCKKQKMAEFFLPDGEPMIMAIESCEIRENSAISTVVKDAGDDPDVTDGCRITAAATLIDSEIIEIVGGEGVGTVTLPGLGITVGNAAINPVPLRMIEENIRRIYPRGGVRVEISVENGREIATRTFNPKVGVLDGISILGTTGIVMPFSHEAFVESIRREISVAVAAGAETIVINSGAKSEKKLKEMFPHIPHFAFIHYGNAIGETLEAAEKAGVKHLVMGIMIGKAVKMAEGHLNTHSHNVRINADFIAYIAEKAGVAPEIINRIRQIKLARELWTVVSPEVYPTFYTHIQTLCVQQAASIFPKNLELHILTD